MAKDRLPQGTPKTAEMARRAFQAYGPELHRFLMRRVHCAHTAHDLAQDVYLRFMLVAREEDIRNAQAFLYQLASNLVYEFNMRERKTQVVYDSDLMEAADRRSALEAVDDPADKLSSAEQLHRLLSPLPKAYRTVLIMRKRDELPAEEIARRLGLSKKTVYEYLTRALARIKEARLEEG